MESGENSNEMEQGPVAEAAVDGAGEIQRAVRTAIDEFRKTELAAEIAKRQDLEQKIAALSVENAKARSVVEEAERSLAVRGELEKLGVVKLDLAYRAVKEEIQRNEDGQLQARGGVSLKEYLAQFVGENPELLPARIAGGSGASSGSRQRAGGVVVDLDRIQPGMDTEEMNRIRQEIARVASQTLRGL